MTWETHDVKDLGVGIPHWQVKWPQWRVLGLLTLTNALNLWHRNILYGLSSDSSVACMSVCEGIPFQPLCRVQCESDDTMCIACAACCNAHDAGWSDVLDGACVSSKEYGYLAGWYLLLSVELSEYIYIYIVCCYSFSIYIPPPPFPP